MEDKEFTPKETKKLVITNKIPAEKKGRDTESDAITSDLLQKLQSMGIEEFLSAYAKVFEGGGKIEITDEEVRIETPEQIISATKKGVQILLAGQETKEIEKELSIKSLGKRKADKKGRISVKQALKEMSAKNSIIFVQETLDERAKGDLPFMILADADKVPCPEGYYPQRLKMDKSGRISVGEFRVRRVKDALGIKASEATRFDLYLANEDMVIYMPEGIRVDKEEIKKLFSPLT